MLDFLYPTTRSSPYCYLHSTSEEKSPDNDQRSEVIPKQRAKQSHQIARRSEGNDNVSF